MDRQTWRTTVWEGAILPHEVGPFIKTGGLVDDPADSGGITKWGVSLRYLKGLPKWVGDLDGDGDVDEWDIRGMTEAQARDIYWRMWQQSGYNKWLANEPHSTRLAVKLFDVRINAGPKRAHIILQRSVGYATQGAVVLDDDGVVGPATRAGLARALSGSRPKETAFLAVYSALQGAFYRDIAGGKNRKFLDGWLRRAHWVPPTKQMALRAAA